MESYYKAAVFYRDVSKPPETSDEFIHIILEETSAGFELSVIRGRFREASTKRSRIYKTLELARTAAQKHHDAAIEKGFQRMKYGFPLNHFVDFLEPSTAASTKR